MSSSFWQREFVLLLRLRYSFSFQWFSVGSRNAQLFFISAKNIWSLSGFYEVTWTGLKTESIAKSELAALAAAFLGFFAVEFSYGVFVYRSESVKSIFGLGSVP